MDISKCAPNGNDLLPTRRNQEKVDKAGFNDEELKNNVSSRMKSTPIQIYDRKSNPSNECIIQSQHFDRSSKINFFTSGSQYDSKHFNQRKQEVSSGHHDHAELINVRKRTSPTKVTQKVIKELEVNDSNKVVSESGLSTDSPPESLFMGKSLQNRTIVNDCNDIECVMDKNINYKLTSNVVGGGDDTIKPIIGSILSSLPLTTIGNAIAIELQLDCIENCKDESVDQHLAEKNELFQSEQLREPYEYVQEPVKQENNAKSSHKHIANKETIQKSKGIYTELCPSRNVILHHDTSAISVKSITTSTVTTGTNQEVNPINEGYRKNNDEKGVTMEEGKPANKETHILDNNYESMMNAVIKIHKVSPPQTMKAMEKNLSDSRIHTKTEKTKERSTRSETCLNPKLPGQKEKSNDAIGRQIAEIYEIISSHMRHIVNKRLDLLLFVMTILPFLILTCLQNGLLTTINHRTNKIVMSSLLNNDQLFEGRSLFQEEMMHSLWSRFLFMGKKTMKKNKLQYMTDNMVPGTMNIYLKNTDEKKKRTEIKTRVIKQILRGCNFGDTRKLITQKTAPERKCINQTKADFIIQTVLRCMMLHFILMKVITGEYFTNSERGKLIKNWSKEIYNEMYHNIKKKGKSTITKMVVDALSS